MQIKLILNKDAKFFSMLLNRAGDNEKAIEQDVIVRKKRGEISDYLKSRMLKTIYLFQRRDTTI